MPSIFYKFHFKFAAHTYYYYYKVCLFHHMAHMLVRLSRNPDSVRGVNISMKMYSRENNYHGTTR